MNDELTDQTKAEQELGRKMAAQNAAAFAQAERAREAETAPPPEDAEAVQAAAEAQPLKVEDREPVFPHAKEPYQPKKSK
jgi:hypothetical protein